MTPVQHCKYDRLLSIQSLPWAPAAILVNITFASGQVSLSWPTTGSSFNAARNKRTTISPIKLGECAFTIFALWLPRLGILVERMGITTIHCNGNSLFYLEVHTAYGVLYCWKKRLKCYGKVTLLFETNLLVAFSVPSTKIANQAWGPTMPLFIWRRLICCFQEEALYVLVENYQFMQTLLSMDK